MRDLKSELEELQRRISRHREELHEEEEEEGQRQDHLKKEDSAQRNGQGLLAAEDFDPRGMVAVHPLTPTPSPPFERFAAPDDDAHPEHPPSSPGRNEDAGLAGGPEVAADGGVLSTMQSLSPREGKTITMLRTDLRDAHRQIGLLKSKLKRTRAEASTVVDMVNREKEGCPLSSCSS